MQGHKHAQEPQGPAALQSEIEVVVDPDPHLQPSQFGAPLWAWGLLVSAVTAVSSAGVVFALMPEVPFLTLSSWRLQLTSVFLSIAGGVQFARMLPADRQRTLRKSWLLGLSGTVLAVHFGAWVYSVQNTSLSHSLLFVSATPLILAAGAWLLRKPISRGELAGTGLGLAGGVILATAAAKSDQQVTVGGDMAALLGAFTFVAYLLIGQNLRKWMPVFVYAAVVTSLAAALLTLAAAAVEGAVLGAGGAKGVFGWATDLRYLPKILYLAVVPGILGHQGFNTLLRYMQPLIITLGCNTEPLLGSLMGWAAGVMMAPGPWTYVGGALVMASTVAVTLAAHYRERAQAAVEVQYARVAVDEALMSMPGDEKEEEMLWPTWTARSSDSFWQTEDAEDSPGGGNGDGAAGGGGGRFMGEPAAAVGSRVEVELASSGAAREGGTKQQGTSAAVPGSADGGGSKSAVGGPPLTLEHALEPPKAKRKVQFE